MKTSSILRCAVAAAFATAFLWTAVRAEPTRKEVLVNELIRVVVLGFGPGDSSPEHTHANPHIAAALTQGDLIDARPGGSETKLSMTQGALAYVPAGVTHTVRNAGSEPFGVVTVDLLKPQTAERNRCAALLSNQKTDCPAKDAEKPGTLVPQYESDQTLVSLLRLEPKTDFKIKAAEKPPVVVALSGDGLALIEIKVSSGAVGKSEKPLKGGDAASTAPKVPLTIRNVGADAARFLVVEFKK